MAARRLHHLIYVTIANCFLFLVVCVVALWTNWWFSVSTNENFSQMGGVNANYGLFSGVKMTQSSTQIEVRYSLKIVCKGMTGCMFSCGTNAKKRKDDLAMILDVKEWFDFFWCEDETDGIDPFGARNMSDNKVTGTRLKLNNSSAVIKADESGEEGMKPVFLSFPLYLTTIAFLGLAIIFAILSGTMALYNTYRTPAQPMLSVNGLYFWNGVSAAFVLLSMIMWVIQFTTKLRKNASISETLTGQYTSNGSGSLGISFWILILPIVFAMANIAILRFRKWKIIKMQEKKFRVMKDEGDGKTGDILF